MISKTVFEKLNFQQIWDSCVLASYAVSSKVFIDDYDLIDYFYALSEHCGHMLSEQCRDHAEICAAYLFICEYRKRDIAGYALMKDVHENSDMKLFNDCRSKFSLEWFTIESDGKNLVDALRDEPTCAMVFINQNTSGIVKGSHSISVFFDDALYFYDTNKPGIQSIANITELGALGHCFLLKANPPMTEN